MDDVTFEQMGLTDEARYHAEQAVLAVAHGLAALALTAKYNSALHAASNSIEL